MGGRKGHPLSRPGTKSYTRIYARWVEMEEKEKMENRYENGRPLARKPLYRL